MEEDDYTFIGSVDSRLVSWYALGNHFNLIPSVNRLAFFCELRALWHKYFDFLGGFNDGQ